jgi:hypothetical protein
MLGSLLLSVAMMGQCATGQCAVRTTTVVQVPVVQYRIVRVAPVVYAAPQFVQVQACAAPRLAFRPVRAVGAVVRGALGRLVPCL